MSSGNGLAHRTHAQNMSQDADVEMHAMPQQQAASRRHRVRHSIQMERDMANEWWARFRGKNREKIGWGRSCINIARSSWLNLLVLLIPLAWVAHFLSREIEPNESSEGGEEKETAVSEGNRTWDPRIAFALCFLAIIPLEKFFDYGGEQMSIYAGKQLGDLLMVTLNNAVEGVLAIILLLKCELYLLQATMVGVVILHLLLVPGTAFMTGGARIWEQHLDQHQSGLNQTLMTIGVLTLLLPAAFFAALDRGSASDLGLFTANATGIEPDLTLINDTTKARFLQMSRGLAIMLLFTYIASRIFLHNPPGDDNALKAREDAHPELKKQEKELEEATPEINPWVGIIFLVICVAIMCITAEFLVESIEFVRTASGVGEIWFGLILLPFVSFAADGAIAMGYFLHSSFQRLLGRPQPPAILARGGAIDNAVQYLLFWMPFIVLLGWWTHRPMSFLFDLFLVAMTLGATFLVNYVTADAKTNWAEGFLMVIFYIMIALCAWFYPGQAEQRALLGQGDQPGEGCRSVMDTLIDGGFGGDGGGGNGTGTSSIFHKLPHN